MTDPVPSTTAQVLAAEALGTFVVVLVGTTAFLFTQGDLVAVALAFGLAVVLATACFAGVSGAHLNPAVSLGAALGGRLAWRRLPLYAGAQVLGAVVASGLVWVLVRGFPDGVRPDGQLGQNFFGDGGFAWWAALLAELVGTAVLVAVVLACHDPRHPHRAAAPLVVGLAYTGLYLALIPLTGASLNPARSLGPALFAGTDALAHVWLFLLAPLLGAAVVGVAHPALFGLGSDPVPGSGLAARRASASAAPRPWDTGTWDTGTDTSPAQAEPRSEHQPEPQFEPEPIIQDGWQWDHAAQEWKPLEGWTPPEPEPAVDGDTATRPATGTDPEPTATRHRDVPGS